MTIKFLFCNFMAIKKRNEDKRRYRRQLVAQVHG